MGRKSNFLTVFPFLAERRPARCGSRRHNYRPLRFESLEGRQLLAVVAGDFNLDGNVNTADYVTWRKSDGTTVGYAAYQANFGTATIQLQGTSINVGESSATAAGQVLTITQASIDLPAH